MLDLKSKLAAAGLVSDEDVRRAEARKAQGKGGRRGRGRPKGSGGGGPRPLDVAQLRARPRGEQYVEVRRVVEAARLDEGGPAPSERARAFHFPKPDGTVGRLFVEGPTADALAQGRARVVGYMSNHGPAHAVVPVELAEAVVEPFPEWAPPTSTDTSSDASAGESPEGHEAR